MWQRRRQPDDLQAVRDAERDAVLSDLRRDVDLLRAANEDFKAQIAYIHALFAEATDEPRRTDHVLGEIEGIGALRADLRAARQTAEFQAAFDAPNPLVTVCTATAGRPQVLIERCLTSIQQQTYKNLQILVMGDHCIDDTAERVAALRDSRIAFHNLPTRGPYPRPGIDRWRVAGTAAANASLPLSKGQFVTYLDDDDAYEPDRIETLLAVAQANRAELVWHKYWALMQDGSWRLWGNGKLAKGQVGTGMIFLHNFFSRVPWDPHAYRIPEPADWNRIRKIMHVRPTMVFVDKPLMRYFRSYEPSPFVAQEGEEFAD